MSAVPVFEDFKKMKIPLWEVISIFIASCVVLWGVFAWADDIEDKQVTTQSQLNQLTAIVKKSIDSNEELHGVVVEGLGQVQQSFKLLEQEVRLRRELQNNRVNSRTDN